MTEYDEIEIREVAHEQRMAGDPLQESATDVAALALSAASLGVTGVVGGAQLYYARASYLLQRDGIPAMREELAEDLADLRWQMHQHARMEAFERGGLEALDEYDAYHWFE